MRSALRRIATMSLAVTALTTLLPAPALAQTVASNACNQPMQDPVSVTRLPDQPNGPSFTRDGCWIFVGVGNGRGVGLLVFHRTNGTITQTRSLSFPGRVQRTAVTRDGKVLVVPATNEVVFLDVEKLTSSKDDPVLGRITDQHFGGAADVRITSDDRYAFVLQSQTSWTSIIDLSKGRTTGFTHDAVVGGIPTGNPLLGIIVSPDDKYLYIPHLELPGDDGPIACENPESFRPLNTRKGGVLAIDIQRALSGAPPVVGSFRVACGGETLALSPNGETMYVSGGQDNVVIAYDIRPLWKGAAPVVLGTLLAKSGQVNTFDSGTRLAVGAAGGAPIVIDISNVTAGRSAVLGTIAGGIPVGRLFPTADGSALIATGRSPNALVVVDLKRLTLQPVKP